MSADPSLDIQGAVVTALKADPDVAAFVGTRVYDQPPGEPVFPYITYGDDQVLQDDPGDPDECGVGFEIFVRIDVWSRAVGQPETKNISGAVRSALHGVDLALPDFRCVLLEHLDTGYFGDPDGLTHQGALTFRALVDGAPESG